MNFAFTVTAGDIMLVSTFLALTWRLSKRLWEHDLMWLEYCQRNGLDANEAKRWLKKAEV